MFLGRDVEKVTCRRGRQRSQELSVQMFHVKHFGLLFLMLDHVYIEIIDMAKILKDSHNQLNDETVDLLEIGSDNSAGRTTPKRPVWEIIVALGEQISDEEWAKAPDDASINYKHYLYGAPKKHV